jgi:hypothetical protein
MALWMGYIAGALEEADYRNKLAVPGFTAQIITDRSEVARVYRSYWKAHLLRKSRRPEAGEFLWLRSELELRRSV